MPGFALLKNMAFEWNGSNFRIHSLQPNGDLLLEQITDGKICSVTREHLLAEYAQGRVSSRNSYESATCTIPSYARPLGDLPEKMRAETTRRWAYVQALIDTESFVFTPEIMRPFIANIALKISDPAPPSVTSIYRWYSRYRQNRDARALIPRIDRRGCKNSRQDVEVQRLTAEAMQEACNASPLATGKGIYVRLLAKIESENRKRIPTNQLKRPALRTVYRMLARVDVYDQIALREGKAAADKRLRVGRRGTTTDNILERVEIDHTPLDLFLIDEKTLLPMGRPTLTVIIDHFSRMLLGYHLSFDNPSTSAVMGALRHAILPKEPAAQTLPSLKIEHQWLCYGCPDVLVADNGLEFHGRDLESVCFDLGIRIQYCPKHQPRFKGSVERYLKTINYFFAHQLPGTSFARLHLRGDYDPQKHAVLTLAEFKHVFEKWVLDIYAQEVHRTLGVTPWAKWTEGLTRRTPGLPSDLRDLQRRIGLVNERALRRDGIWLNGIRYSGAELQPIISAYGEGVRVRVLFDPEDLGTIQVWGPQQESPLTVFAVDQGYAHNLTLRQNELIRSHLRESGANTENSTALQNAKHDLVNSVQELMNSQKQRHRRKAAAIRGISSSKPDSQIPVLTSILPSASQKPRRPSTSDDAPPLARYVSFRVKN